MIDTFKLKFVKTVGAVVFVIVVFLIGFGFGRIGSTKAPSKAETKPTQVKTVALKKSDVEEFLMTYYTKKDLGENRKRYKDYMTAAAYEKEIAKEDDPVNQTNKGFIVDYKYKSSDIYINPDTLQALVRVNYVNTVLEEKGSYDQAQKDVANQVDLRLTYFKNQDGSLSISNIETIYLSDAKKSGNDENNSSTTTTNSITTERRTK